MNKNHTPKKKISQKYIQEFYWNWTVDGSQLFCCCWVIRPKIKHQMVELLPRSEQVYCKKQNIV